MNIIELLLIIVITLFITFIYFLPAIVAGYRGRGFWAYFSLNYVVGWTIIGWFAILMMALTPFDESEYVDQAVQRTIDRNVRNWLSLLFALICVGLLIKLAV